MKLQAKEPDDGNQLFLLPKDEVAYIKSSASMKEALEQLEAQHYTAIPVIDQDGKYVATLSEGDLLWKMRSTPD